MFVSQFPTPINKSFNTWENVITDIIPKIDQNTIIVAHSVGVPFILRIITKYNLPVNNVFLVSRFITKLGDRRFDEINKTFLSTINWNKFNALSPETNIYHSDNDPYVNKKHALELCRHIPGSRLTLIKQARHFNSESGYNEFSQILEDINTLL